MDMISKPVKIRSKAVRNSAKGEACTLRLPGVCNGDWSTTVFAHVNFGGHGMATKESDLSGCYACQSCHDAIDGRVYFRADIETIYRAVLKTLHKLYEKGILEVKP